MKCPRCGQCRAYCPVFGELRDEASVARARIALAKAMIEGKATVDADARRCLEECTLCLACTANCPSSVAVEEIILAARAQLASQLGITTVQRAVLTLLGRRSALLPYLMAAGSVLQRLPFARLPDDSGLRLRFPLGGWEKRVVPALARRPLLRQLPRQVGEAERGTVTYFVGCFDNFADVQVGRAVVGVLRHNGYRVSLPPEQGCCAMPLLANGLLDAARARIKSNLEVLLSEGTSTVVAACASCGSALRHLYPMVMRMAGETEWAEKAQSVAERVRDLTEFLVEKGIRPPQGEVRRCVTFHDPCHLARGQTVKAQPRELLRAIPGLEFAEMGESDRCCGGAGTFSFAHYELARRINDRKVDNIARSAAEIVATECPGCKLQITDGLRRRGVPARARQTVELLAEAYGPAAMTIP
ncbi:MAG: (Fe-S)-binding protein [Chloroflexota bacterium]